MTASAVSLHVYVGPLRLIAAATPGSPVLLAVDDLSAYLANRARPAKEALTKALETLAGNLSDHARDERPALTLDDALLLAGAVGASLPKGTAAEIAGAFREAEVAFAAHARTRAQARGALPVVPLALSAPEEIPPPPASLTRAQLADREQLLALFEAHRWNKVKVAQALGLARRSLYRRLALYGIPVSDERGGDRTPRAAKESARSAGAVAAKPRAKPKSKR